MTLDTTDDQGFMTVTSCGEKHDRKLRLFIGAGINGCVAVILADSKHKVLQSLQLEPEEALEVSRALDVSAEMVYGTA